MPVSKIKINGKMYPIGGSVSAETIAQLKGDLSRYVDELNALMAEEIAGINTALGELNTYVDGAFKDGIISEAEAKAIKSYLMTLESKKIELDREYSDLYGNVYINAESIGIMESAKDLYDQAYIQLVNAIVDSIVDGAVSYTHLRAHET